MKRITRIAKRWAGEMRPYGNVSAASPDTVPPGGAAPKRWNWPCARARKTTTQSAYPAATAAAALPTAAEPPPPPPPPPAPLHVGEAELGQAERGGEPRGIVAIVAVGGEAVHLARVDPGVLAGAQDGPQRQRDLRLGRPPVLVVRRLADPGDRDPSPDGARRAHPRLLAILILECRSISGTGKISQRAGVVTRDLASVRRARGDGQEGGVRAGPRQVQAIKQPLERGLVRHEQPLVGDRE